MPNPWDIGTTRILTGLGYEALATTSAGLAYSLGRRDGEAAVTREEALEHAAMIAGATELPVNGDLENGFGHDPESVAETIRGAAAAGLVGCSIEDSTSAPGEPIYPALAGGRAHRSRRRSRARPAIRVHAHGARRELPARPQRPRRHDRAAAGLRQGGRRRAVCAGTARHRRHPHASARQSRSPSTCSRWPARRASSCCRRPAFAASASARGSSTPPRGVPARGEGRAGARDVRVPRRRRDLARSPALHGGASELAPVDAPPARRLQVFDAHDRRASCAWSARRGTAPRTSPTSAARRRSRGRPRP